MKRNWKAEEKKLQKEPTGWVNLKSCGKFRTSLLTSVQKDHTDLSVWNLQCKLSSFFHLSRLEKWTHQQSIFAETATHKSECVRVNCASTFLNVYCSAFSLSPFFCFVPLISITNVIHTSGRHHFIHQIEPTRNDFSLSSRIGTICMQ